MCVCSRKPDGLKIQLSWNRRRALNFLLEWSSLFPIIVVSDSDESFTKIKPLPTCGNLIQLGKGAESPHRFVCRSLKLQYFVFALRISKLISYSDAIWFSYDLFFIVQTDTSKIYTLRYENSKHEISRLPSRSVLTNSCLHRRPLSLTLCISVCN